jgi:hypothetical protein
MVKVLVHCVGLLVHGLDSHKWSFCKFKVWIYCLISLMERHGRNFSLFDNIRGIFSLENLKVSKTLMI